jgi:hypothetical protein
MTGCPGEDLSISLLRYFKKNYNYGSHESDGTYRDKADRDY